MNVTSAGLSDLILSQVENLSIDDVLRALIMDSDLMEVACCLDMIAGEDKQSVRLFENGKQIYPVVPELEEK